MHTNDQDLAVLFEKVNRVYFGNILRLRSICWVPVKKFTHESPHLWLWAQCLVDSKRIRIFQGLKGKAPKYVIAYLIYHELLHLFWLNHCRQFRIAEMKFKHYEKADQWLDRHEYLFQAG